MTVVSRTVSYADLKNERGAALLLTLILMLVLSLLTVSLYELLQASTQITGNHRLELRTAYVADAGVEAAINELRIFPPWVDGFTDVTFGDGSYTVSVVSNVPGSNPAIAREVDIISTGTISNFQRTLSAHVFLVEIGGSDPPSFAATTMSYRFQ